MADFRKSTIYQIYTKSFMDASGDGFGDIKGVTARLDYLAWLGVDYVWLTPFFCSPQRDNGYDVSDYRKVDPIFGTMEDVEELIAEGKKRGIGLMFDMVFNHTSTDHVWFQKALEGDPYYMDYYIFRDGRGSLPPTNWESKFGGNAWKYVPKLDKWYLHLYDEGQADLNWDNPKVREELKDIVRFWKQKGAEGFRFDVVNLVSKPEVFQDDTHGDGRRFYTDGPHIHEYLRELAEDTGICDMITVGEMSSTSLEACIGYTKPERRELSMCFHFHHLKVDYKDGDKWELMEPDRRKLKELFAAWQEGMEKGGGWEAVFWCNHDQPRAVSRFGDDGKYWKESAKMLAGAIHFMRGTPYVYQGEEIGMTNAGYDAIGQFRDVESLNYYEILLGRGKSQEEALKVIQERSRDNGRTPMQWDASGNAGFTEGEPWIRIPDNHQTINVEEERKDEDSILYFYRRLIALRKQYPVIAQGDIHFFLREDEHVLAYCREDDQALLTVVCNLTGKDCTVEDCEALHVEGAALLAGNYPGQEETIAIQKLRPYEFAAYWRQK